MSPCTYYIRNSLYGVVAEGRKKRLKELEKEKEKIKKI
tara:strand:- start:272 stop:385 length:114 start_codon:yes stop_codon:yes gene_type:complete